MAEHPRLVTPRSDDARPAVPVGFVILAAGRGHRMGRPKWQVVWHGRTFLAWIRASLTRCQDLLGRGRLQLDPCIVAASADQDAVLRAWPDARCVRNPDPASEPIVSIRLGVRSWTPVFPPLVGIWPVDHPAVPPRDLALLLDAALRDLPGHRYQVWKPGFGGDTGHPILIGADLLPELLDEARATGQGLRGILRQWQAQTRIVPVTTPAVLWNFNHPEQLDRHVPVWEPGPA